MANISIPRFFSAIFNAFTRLWTYIRNVLARHHVLFFFTFAFAVLRTTLFVNAHFWTYLYRFAVQTRQMVVAADSGSASGLSFLTGFSLVNSIFPVYELFVFLGSLFLLKRLAFVYSFIRGIYKSIPFKAT